MKINLLWEIEFPDEACYEIIIEDIEDYEVLSLLILENDYIDDIYVKYVEYNVNEWDSIKIYGIKTNKDIYYLNDLDGKELTEYYIRGTDEIIIHRFRYFAKEKYNMKKQYEIEKYNTKRQYAAYCQLNELKKSISEKNIQDKGFEILKKYMMKKNDLIIYGNQSIDLMKKEELQVLLITFDVFLKQDEKTRETLKSHKCKKTNIIIYDEKSKYWKEINDYGCIIGVLNEK